jgi:hypothetical protein
MSFIIYHISPFDALPGNVRDPDSSKNDTSLIPLRIDLVRPFWQYSFI